MNIEDNTKDVEQGIIRTYLYDSQFNDLDLDYNLNNYTGSDESDNLIDTMSQFIPKLSFDNNTNETNRPIKTHDNLIILTFVLLIIYLIIGLAQISLGWYNFGNKICDTLFFNIWLICNGFSIIIMSIAGIINSHVQKYYIISKYILLITICIIGGLCVSGFYIYCKNCTFFSNQFYTNIILSMMVFESLSFFIWMPIYCIIYNSS